MKKKFKKDTYKECLKLREYMNKVPMQRTKLAFSSITAKFLEMDKRLLTILSAESSA